MLLAITAFASGFIAIPLVNNVTLVVLFLPSLTAPIPFCYRVESLVCRQSFVHQQNENLLNQLHHAQHWLDHRSAARHAVGDAEHQSALWLAAICSAFPMLFIQIWVKRSEKIIATETGSAWSPKVLLQDKALLWFTCSGFLASFVSGAFASCISQYVMVIADGDFAERWLRLFFRLMLPW